MTESANKNNTQDKAIPQEQQYRIFSRKLTDCGALQFVDQSHRRWCRTVFKGSKLAGFDSFDKACTCL